VTRVVVAGIGQRHGDDDPLAAMAAELRNGGAEVIFTGWDQTPARVVRAALQEDVDAIGLCGGTDGVLARVRGLLADKDAVDITVFAPPR